MSVISSSVVGGDISEKVKKLKQRRNGFLSHLTKVTNRGEMYFTTHTPILKEIGILKENIEFALYKLQKNTEDICALTSEDDCIK